MPYCPPNNATFTCTQAYSTIAPNIFQLQYWLWNLVVMFAITGILLAYSRNNIVDMNSLLYTVLLGFTIGAFIDLMLNTLVWIFPIFLLFGFIVFIWRGRT